METTTVEPGPGQNLNDLQNYLVHFGKEIETATQPVSEQLQDIALMQPAAENVAESDSTASIIQLQTSKAEQTGGPQFTSGFYTEQPVIATSLGATVQELPGMTPTISAAGSQNIGSSSTINTEADHTESVSKQQDESSDALENYNDYIASLTGEKMDGEELTVEPVTLAQELAVNSMMEGLVAQTSAGKMIRIVSIGKDGQMQLVGEDMPAGISIANLQLKQEPQTELDALSGIDPKHSDVIDGSDPVAVLASVATNTSSVNQIQNACRGDLNDPQLVALQNSADSSQPQLVAVQGGSGENMQIIGGPDSLSGQGNQMMLNSFQTVTIVPSDVNQESGIVSYVLIVSPDADKDGSEKHIALDMAGYDLKDEALREVSEEIIQEDGTTHRVLKISPQNFFPGSQAQLVCNICNYTSPKRYLLLRHMKTHSEDRPYKCNICERGFKTLASLTNHVNTHTGTRPHKCKDCESSFTTSGELVRHIRYRHTFEKPHKCPECDYASVELSKLKRHIRMHTGERPYQCHLCSYASPDTYKLKRHLRIHTGEKPYECDLCHARFTQSNSLKAHKLIHSGDKPIFQCELCPTTCGRKTDLKIHYQKLHTSEHPLLCRKCGQNFPDRYTYKLHIKQHDGEKCFKCEECDYAALSQRHLESHMLVHSGEKPFECNGCDQTFRQKQLLRRHQNLHHTPDYIKPVPKTKCYNCSECDKTFAHRGYLARHLESHGKHVTFSESEEENDVNDLPTISAQHVLESNLMQEWRDGKLGNSPQVVIVHPDGRVEEVTPKLQAPPDRTVDDLLEAMSAHTSGSEEGQKQTQEGTKSQKSGENEGSETGGNGECKQPGITVNQGSHDIVMEGVDLDQSAVVCQSVQEQGVQQKQTQTRCPIGPDPVMKATEQCQMKEAGTQAAIDSDSEDDSFKPMILSCRTITNFEKKVKAMTMDKNIYVDNRNAVIEEGTSNIVNSEVANEDLTSKASVKKRFGTVNNGSKCVTVVLNDKSETITQPTPYFPVKEANTITTVMNAQMDTAKPGSSIPVTTLPVLSRNASSSSSTTKSTAASCMFSNIESGQVIQVSNSVSPLCSQSELVMLANLDASKTDLRSSGSNLAMSENPDSGGSIVSTSCVSKPTVTVTVGSLSDHKLASSASLLKQHGNVAATLKALSPDRLTRSMKRREIELGASPAKRTRRATTADSK